MEHGAFQPLPVVGGVRLQHRPHAERCAAGLRADGQIERAAGGGELAQRCGVRQVRHDTAAAALLRHRVHVGLRARGADHLPSALREPERQLPPQPARADDEKPHSRCTLVSEACAVGVITTSEMFTCAGRVATQRMASATSSAVSGSKPR